MSETNATNLLIKTNTSRIVVLEEDVKMITKNMATNSFVKEEIGKLATKLDNHHEKQNGESKVKLFGVGLPIPIVTLVAAVIGAEIGYAGIKRIAEFFIKIVTGP